VVKAFGAKPSFLESIKQTMRGAVTHVMVMVLGQSFGPNKGSLRSHGTIFGCGMFSPSFVAQGNFFADGGTNHRKFGVMSVSEMQSPFLVSFVMT